MLVNYVSDIYLFSIGTIMVFIALKKSLESVSCSAFRDVSGRANRF